MNLNGGKAVKMSLKGGGGNLQELGTVTCILTQSDDL